MTESQSLGELQECTVIFDFLAVSLVFLGVCLSVLNISSSVQQD